MAASTLAIILFGSLLLLILFGIPVAFSMSGISLVVGFIYWGGYSSAEAFVLGAHSKSMEFTLTALPLYILMAAILRYSDLAEGMYEAAYRWLGGVKGGLAVGTTLISSIFSAMVGISTVSTATLGVTARPSMIKRGYDSKLVSGVILAGGALGILIPPSIIMILYATEANVSAGAMFFSGIVPGIVAIALFILYILVRSYINPNLAPSIPGGNIYTLSEKFESLRSVILPIFVIVIVLGAIYTGAATPTEAAGIGVIGALISAVISRKLTLGNIKKMLTMTVRLNGMVFWIIIGAAAYSRIVTITNIGPWLGDLIVDSNFNRWGVLILIMLLFFVLGMFIDPAGIILMTAPLFIPVLIALEFDLIWFGALYVLNMCVAFMSPPFGFNLFVLQGVAPEIETKDLYLSTIPFIAIFILVMILVAVFPQLALWLPSVMIN